MWNITGGVEEGILGLMRQDSRGKLRNQWAKQREYPSLYNAVLLNSK